MNLTKDIAYKKHNYLFIIQLFNKGIQYKKLFNYVLLQETLVLTFRSFRTFKQKICYKLRKNTANKFS